MIYMHRNGNKMNLLFRTGSTSDNLCWSSINSEGNIEWTTRVLSIASQLPNCLLTAAALYAKNSRAISAIHHLPYTENRSKIEATKSLIDSFEEKKNIVCSPFAGTFFRSFRSKINQKKKRGLAPDETRVIVSKSP